MKLSRSPTNQEWDNFARLGPGVRMYNGKMTLFWNGETLRDAASGEWLVYDQEERQTWEVIIVLPGVEVIPEWTFVQCRNVKVVIMADTVRRIERFAFLYCKSIMFVKLSTNLEFIGYIAFSHCESLTSIFIPQSCREICIEAFCHCTKLIIFHVPRNTQLGEGVIDATALARASPFPTDRYGIPNIGYRENVNEWIKNHHADNQFALHRACASHNPLEEVIFDIVKRQGIGAFKKSDSVGVTASQYLSQNPFTEIKEQKIMKHYILDMLGEIV